jgi:large subunit ribosomal protein L14
MIQSQTRLKLGDNSGVQIAKCFLIYKSKFGYIGFNILVSIQFIKPQSKIKKGSIYKAIIIRTKYKIKRKNGVCCIFNENVVVILNNKNDILGTRIFGPITNEIRKFNVKLLSLSYYII